MFKTDILFTGYYGHQNTGDDAFVEVASWGAKKFWSKDNNRFLARTSRLPKTIIPNKGYPFEIKRTYGLQSKILLNNTDAFVYAGGSTIHSTLDSSNIRYKAFVKKRNGAEFKYGGIGVSIGPFKNSEDEKAVKSYLKQMDFLAVRDQTSFDLVSNWDLPYKPINAFDLAALLPEVYDFDFNIRKKNNIKTIGISVCPYESHQKGMNLEKEMKRNSMLIDLLKKIDTLGVFHFKFYVINGNEMYGDLKLTKETTSRVSPKSFELCNYDKNTRNTWESIAKCDFIISTRLHAAIFACFAEVPFMLNEYHRKCEDFLSNVGYNEEYRLYNSEYNVEEKALQVMDILQGDYIKPKYMKEMIDKARLNFNDINL